MLEGRIVMAEIASGAIDDGPQQLLEPNTTPSYLARLGSQSCRKVKFKMQVVSSKLTEVLTWVEAG